MEKGLEWRLQANALIELDLGTVRQIGLIDDGQDSGDEVKIVFPGSPAEAAGLRRGDLITDINGTKPADDAHDPAFTQPVGTVLHLTVRRDGVEHIYDVTLDDVL